MRRTRAMAGWTGVLLLGVTLGCASSAQSGKQALSSPPVDGCASLLAGRGGPTSPVTLSRAAKLRWVAFGDFGTGSVEQQAVAVALAEYARSHPLDLGLTLGDNFYEEGLTSAADPRWKGEWEDLY